MSDNTLSETLDTAIQYISEVSKELSREHTEYLRMKAEASLYKKTLFDALEKMGVKLCREGHCSLVDIFDEQLAYVLSRLASRKQVIKVTKDSPCPPGRSESCPHDRLSCDDCWGTYRAEVDGVVCK